MLDSFYHMVLKLIEKSQVWRENVKTLQSFTQRYNQLIMDAII